MRFGTWERRVTLAAAAVGLTACASRASDGDAQSSEAVTVCAGTTVEGIDVSEFQGNINWNSVKASGRSFAFIRASDGTGHLDPTFAGNWGAARSAGLLRSVYQFFRPTEDANAQADLVLQKLAADGAGELPPMLDVEVTDEEALVLYACERALQWIGLDEAKRQRFERQRGAAPARPIVE